MTHSRVMRICSFVNMIWGMALWISESGNSALPNFAIGIWCMVVAVFSRIENK